MTVSMYFLIAICTGFISCSTTSQPEKELVLSHKDRQVQVYTDSVELSEFPDTIQRQTAHLQDKIDAGLPIFVHVHVPLCDNVNQGIVPTSASLGNGQSLRTNLYWATSKGMKRYFDNKSGPWKKVYSILDPEDGILERVLFSRTFPNGANVYMMVDAYDGARMKQCMDDFFGELSGNRSVQDDSLYTGKSDLVVFNGHNGLMDTSPDSFEKTDTSYYDAMVIGCISKDYFNPYFRGMNTYPVLTTTNLLYPGAFILDDALTAWVGCQPDIAIKNAAGDAYHRVKKCGQKGGRRLFSNGW